MYILNFLNLRHKSLFAYVNANTDDFEKSAISK